MRVAALYDIHGNLPALEAVLAAIRHEQVDQVVVGGDVVLGPMPNETLACLLDLATPVRFLQGNCDREVLAAKTGTESPSLLEQVRESVQWVAQQLSPEHERELDRWPMAVHIAIPELGDVLFCHATPRSDSEIFTRLTAEDRLVPVFDGVNAAVVVCGHTHMQFDRTINGVRVVNAGSVGMPFGAPGAHWLIVGPGVEFRQTAYDLAQAAERIRATSYPHAEEFAARNVLNPPSEHETLGAFARVELC